jgi:hypothetical protein
MAGNREVADLSAAVGARLTASDFASSQFLMV